MKTFLIGVPLGLAICLGISYIGQVPDEYPVRVELKHRGQTLQSPVDIQSTTSPEAQNAQELTQWQIAHEAMLGQYKAECDVGNKQSCSKVSLIEEDLAVIYNEQKKYKDY